MRRSLCHGHRVPPPIIEHAVWLRLRLTIRLRDVDVWSRRHLQRSENRSISSTAISRAPMMPTCQMLLTFSCSSPVCRVTRSSTAASTPPTPPLPPKNADAAQHGRRERGEFEVLPDVGAAAAEPSQRHQGRDTGQQPACHIGDHADPVDLDADQTRRPFVMAERIDPAAPGGRGQQHAGQEERRQGQRQEGQRQARHEAPAPADQPGRNAALRGSAGQRQGPSRNRT